MTNTLAVFNEQEILGKQFRIYGDVDNPLFLAKDVAKWIEHSNTSVMLSKVDDEERGLNNVYTLGGIQNLWFLTEDGLYEVLMQSRKPIAKAFKKVVKQILKSIRKDGGYIATNEDDDDETILAKALLVAQKTIDRKSKELEEVTKKLVETNALYEPMGDTFKQIVSDGTDKSVGDVAHLAYGKEFDIEIGRTRLYQKLRDWGFVKKGGTEPTQQGLSRGYLKVVIEHVKNTGRDERVTKVTPTGEIYIVDRLVRERKKELENVSM